jgi:hypothetical protein
LKKIRPHWRSHALIRLAKPIGCETKSRKAGEAPRELVATKRDAGGSVLWSRPVCAYPQVPRDEGAGLACAVPMPQWSMPGTMNRRAVWPRASRPPAPFASAS